MHILGAIAEFERSRIAERVRAGLQRARAQGNRLGRPNGDLPVDRPARGRFAVAIRSGRRARRLARDDQALAPGSENPRRHGDGFAPRAACFPTRSQSSGWAQIQVLWGTSRATDAQALFLLRRQSADGRWAVQTLRPPIESNDIEVTAMSMRAVQLYAPEAKRAGSAQAIGRARDWLASAKGEVTEERAFRLLGLAWAEADTDTLRAAARELLALQRNDGGWSQEPSLESDSYATGEALTALRESGIAAADDLAVRRGVEFLLRTQLQDGSWYVKSRSVPIQAFLDAPQPTVSRHLSYLRRAGLVRARQERSWNFCELSPAKKAFHKKLLECLSVCFRDVPELEADGQRARSIRASGRCCR